LDESLSLIVCFCGYFLYSDELTLLCSEVNASLLQRLRDNDSTLTNLKVTTPPKLEHNIPASCICCAFLCSRIVSSFKIVAQITKAIFKPALAEEFFSAMTVHEHLERLDLDCVGLGMDLGSKLCRDVLPRMPKLKILDLKVCSTCHSVILWFWYFHPQTCSLSRSF
jgi:hypothetical protein